MNGFLDRILSVQTDDELVARRGRLLNIVILIMTAADLLTLLHDIVLGLVRPEFLSAELLIFVVFGVFYWYTRRGHRWTSFVFVVFAALIAPYAFQTELQSPIAVALAGPIVVVPLVASSWLCMPVAAVEAIILYVLSAMHGGPLPSPLVIVILGALGLVSWLASRTLENAFKEARRNASDLAGTNRELEANRVLLEARTRDLERESAYQAASAEVGRAATSILEAGQLMEQVVELIRERFDLYYVGLFLADENSKWAVLRAGTGEAGRAMLARNHQLQIGSGSMIGWSIANKQARVALEVSQDTVRLATAELPDTRAEAALPLRSRGRVIGALTVQSAHPGVFDQDSIIVLQVMADQVAVAIDNARLFAESQAALAVARRAYGQLSHQAWTEMLHAQPNLGFIKNQRGVSRADNLWRPAVRTALQTGEPSLGDSNRTRLVIPVKIRDHVIGVIDAHKPEGAWTPEEIVLVESLTEQMGVALESARLYQDTQRRAARERILREISDRMQGAADMEALMRITAEELNKALGGSRAYVRLGTEALPSPNGDEPSGEGDD